MTPAAPVRIRCSAVRWSSTPPATTGTSSSEMKVLRFSGSPSCATRSAEMMVPWMTSRSIPAATSAGVSACAFCGLTRTAVVTPASRIRATAAPSRSGSSGAECNCCSSRIAADGSGSFSAASITWAILASTSACLPIRPSPLSTPRPPMRPSSMANSRRHQRVGGMRQHRDLEPVGVELPGRRHVLRGPGAPRRHDVDVVEFIGAAGGSAHADFDHVSHGVTPPQRA